MAGERPERLNRAEFLRGWRRSASDAPAGSALRVAVIGDRCFERRGITCRACQDVCELSAIRFRPAACSLAEPSVQAGLCTGCGACLAPCPAGAISLSAATPEAVA